MPELHLVSPPERAGQGTLIFVHGLDGDPFATWRWSGDDTFWPNWIAQEIPELEVYTLGYDAAPSKWHGTSMGLPGRAINILARLVGDRVEEKRLVFVCHSLGGLVVKQLLRTSCDSTNSIEKSVFTNTQGVVFLGTPHTGSTLATWADRFRLFWRPSAALEDLKLDSHWLSDLNDWYKERSLGAEISTLTFVENRSVGGIPIVSSASGDSGIPGSRSIPIDANHIEIAKPRSRNDVLYRRVVRFLEECLVTPKELVSGHLEERTDAPSLYDWAATAINEATEVFDVTLGRQPPAQKRVPGEEAAARKYHIAREEFLKRREVSYHELIAYDPVMGDAQGRYERLLKTVRTTQERLADPNFMDRGRQTIALVTGSSGAMPTIDFLVTDKHLVLLQIPVYASPREYRYRYERIQNVAVAAAYRSYFDLLAEAASELKIADNILEFKPCGMSRFVPLPMPNIPDSG